MRCSCVAPAIERPARRIKRRGFGGAVAAADRQPLRMNSSLFAILAVVIGGAAASLQAPTNALLTEAVGSSVNAAFISFAVGTVALGVLALALQARPDMAATRALPWYVWIGGLYGAAF